MTVFQKIINREVPAHIVYEDDLCLAFHDIEPQAPLHILIIPKKPIPSMTDLTTEDQGVMGHLMLKATEIARSQKIDSQGFRLVINTGADGGQTVDHLHIHLLAQRPLSWPPG